MRFDVSVDGWIKLHRCLQDNQLWKSEKFSRGQAWVDLILLANYQPGFFYKRDIKITVERGQCGVSEVGLSERWKWSRTKVRKFLKDLEKEHQVVVKKNNITQIVTIVNYEKYQKKEQQEDSKKTAEEQQEDTNKKDKKEKNNNKKFDPFSVRPEWFSTEDYEDMLSHRKKKKAAQTDRAIKSVISEIEKSVSRGFTAKECVDEMCNRNWTGYKDEWMKGKPKADDGWK